MLGARAAESRRMSPRLLALAALASALLAGPALAHDWSATTALETVEVVTHDADGAVRETTVWIVGVDGDAFIRTGGTTWGDNVRRERRLALRANGEEMPLAVEPVADSVLREKVAAAFRAKYGWSDALMSPLRGSDPLILRLVPPAP
jgi:hypothetical protein